MVQYLPSLEKGKRYLLSAETLPQVKNVGKKWAKIVIRQADKKNVTINYTGKNIDLGSSGLQKLNTVFTPAPNAASFQVYIQSSGLEKSDQITIDNITLDIAPALKADQSNFVQNGSFEHHAYEAACNLYKKEVE